MTTATTPSRHRTPGPHIVLIGFMGAGKSTLAAHVATRLQRALVDVDDEIAREAGADIDALFAEHGEAGFRSLEAKCLAGLLSRLTAPTVIATGGGVVESDDNWSVLRQLGVVVWLQAPLEAVRERIAGTARPLAGEGVAKLFAARLAKYAQADVAVDNVATVAEAGRNIVTAVADFRQAVTVQVTPPGRRYSVSISHRGLDATALWAARQGYRRVFVFVDERLKDLYGAALLTRLEACGCQPQLFSVRGGEVHKGLEQVERMWGQVLAGGADRHTLLIAVGGGVTTDLVGFVAATALRGLDVAYVATSLLAMADASVGGKTGFNHSLGKNLVGVFHQPRFVACALETLPSLDRRQVRAGWAEIIKVAVIWDRAFFERLERRDFEDPPTAEEVARAVEIKAEVVAMDEREAGPRKLLNFGHTVGHALEKVAGYGAVLHGEAVAVGMVAALQLSVHQGVCPLADARRVVKLLRLVGLPTTVDRSISHGGLTGALAFDKKRADGDGVAGVNFVRCLGLGRGDTRWVPLEEVPLVGLPALLEES